MVATVGSISIDLSTNAVKFQDGFKRAATTVDRETKRMSASIAGLQKASRAASGVLTGFVGGLAGGAAVAALGSLSGALGKASEALHEFEEIGNKAKASGLSAEFYQTLQFAAHKTDVEMDTLNTSLEIFTKNVGLAKQGAGAMTAGLERLNPQLLDAILNAGSQEERLRLVADAMAKMQSATDKAALATAAFGKGGQDMVRMLDAGSASLDAFLAEAKRLDIILTDADIQKFADAADEVDDLAFNLDRKLKIALANSSVAIEAGMNLLVDFTEDVGKLSKAIDAYVKNPNVATFNRMLGPEAPGKTKLPFQELFGRTEAFQVKATAASRSVEEINTNIRETHELLSQQFKLGIDTTESLQRLNDLQDELDNVTRRNAAAAAQTPGSLSGLEASAGKAMEAAAERQTAAAEETTDAVDRTTEETERVGRYVQDLDRNIGGYIGDLGGSVEYSFKNLNDAVDALGHSIVEMAKINVDPNFSFTGLGGSTPNSGSSESWAGRRYTYKTGSVTMPLSSGVAGTPEAPVSETVGETGTINVSVVVKPVMEGTRLSAQSTAEIKQAASAGIEAGLRAYHGR